MDRRSDVTARILVISPHTKIREILACSDALSRYEVFHTEPGPNVVHVTQREQPDVAVIDGIHERSDAAELEIALLKCLSPDVRIIVLSGQSSVRDARIVEQGIFYYLAGSPGSELIRVVEAAARSRATMPAKLANE